MTCTSISRLLWWSLASELFLNATQLNALNLTDFRTCVSNAPGIYSVNTTCTLDPNWSGSSIIAWDVVSFPITIGRPIVAEGNAGYPQQVTLKRASNMKNILVVASTAPNVTIQNLVFDGNKTAYPYTYPTPEYVDVEFQAGSWNNYIKYSLFKNAPDRALDVRYYTYIQHCQFLDSGNVGVWSVGTSGSVTDIGIYTSYFTRTGANAVYFKDGAHNSILYDTDLVQNHYTCPFFSSGGQVILDETTSGISVQNNRFDGAYASCVAFPNASAGLEGLGSSHSVTGNSFINHRWFGLYFTAASSITISNNTVQSNLGIGILLTGTAGGLPCSPNPSYTVNSNTISSNSGYSIYAARNGCVAGPSSATITMSGNSIFGNTVDTPSLNNP